MRYEVVVTDDTSEVVGYARWILPKDNSIAWVESQVREPTHEELLECQAAWKEEAPEGSPKGANQAMLDEFSDLLEVEEKLIMNGGSMLCEASQKM